MVKLKFRQAGLDDAALAADLVTASYPDEPLDPVVARFRWAHPREDWTLQRSIAELNGRPIAYVLVAHAPWTQVPERHCDIEFYVDLASQSEAVLDAVLEWAGERAVADGGRILHTGAAEDEPKVSEALGRLGYEPDRSEKVWQLDLKVHGDRLLAEAKAAAAKVKGEHVELLTLSQWSDPNAARKLHELNELTLQDVPHTVPILPQTFENFSERLSSPDLRHDRFWIALANGEAVALSFLRFPPVRGNVWTGYTCSHPEHRGQGIARAVKLQSLAQAIELGIPFVRTDNDSENAPMLHINETLGYDPRPGFINFTKRVDSE